MALLQYRHLAEALSRFKIILLSPEGNLSWTYRLLHKTEKTKQNKTKQTHNQSHTKKGGKKCNTSADSADIQFKCTLH